MNANGWHYAEGGKTFGPVDLKELQVILFRISDPRDLLVWRVGFEGWQRVGDVPELAQLIDKPPPLPKTPEPDTVPKRRGREWKWHFLQSTLLVLIASAVAMSNVLWQWGLTNSVAGLIGLGAGWLLTVALPHTLGRRVAIQAITLPILAVGLILVTYRYATLGDKEGLIGKTRSDFVESSLDACLKDPTANSVEPSVLKEYCNCYSSSLADKISINDLRSLAKKDQNTWLTAMQPKIDAAASACLPR
jgi:GYF domain 2